MVMFCYFSDLCTLYNVIVIVRALIFKQINYAYNNFFVPMLVYRL